MAFTNVSTTDPAGFYQHTFGGDTAPACSFIPAVPTMVCDSFVTLGEECATNGSTTDPDFDGTSFNSTGEVSGGWYNSAPANGQGAPDANGRVMIGRFSYKQNKTTSGDVCVFTKLAGSEEITEFLIEPFDCADPGMQAGTGGECAPGTIWFVDDDTNGEGENDGCCDGASTCNGWDNACPDLQSVLDNVAPGDSIWVAAGTYKPTKRTDPIVPRSKAFALASCLELYGGFEGNENPATFDLDLRDFVGNETILSGDIGTPDVDSDNSHHVVVAGSNTSSVDETAILDGFSVTKGNANVPSSGPNGTNQGSAVNIWINSTPKLENCTFRQNWSAFHAAVNDHGGATLIDCDFLENHSDDFAGGLYVHSSIATSVTRCDFCDNTAVNEGGGAYVKENTNGPDPTFTDCTFSGNQAFHGGGIYCGIGRSPSLTGCTFSGNSTSGTNNAGAGMYVQGGNPSLSDCTFQNNISEAPFGSGGGMYNEAASPTVKNCIFKANQAPGALGEAPGSTGCGGGMINVGSSPILTNCKFFGNSATYGAGMYDQEDDQDPENPLQSSPTVINCIFSGNDAESKGGGMFLTHASAATLTNCIFSGNTAATEGGGGIRMESTSTLTATNCSFSGNSASTLGGGVLVGGCVGGPLFTTNNSVFWGNSDTGGMDESAQIHAACSLIVESSYTDIQGLVLGGARFCPDLCGEPPDQYCCNGNIGDLPEHDPDFIDPDGVDDIVGTEDDNLRLLGGSPCIDAADNDAVTICSADLDGKERFFDDLATPNTGNPPGPGDVVDMGAYEFGSPVAPDCNENGTPDECDIDSGSSLDCDGQGVPDECCPADMSGDGAVGSLDLAILLASWGSCSPCTPGVPACTCQPDLDNDCLVGPIDLANLLGAWGTCP